jgi:AcrR family transcriptional regulator
MADTAAPLDTGRDTALLPSKDTAHGARELPRIRRPSQKRSRERYELILACTERLLATHSPEQLSIHAVAEAAGISPPSVYHFFPDLTRLYVALAERYMEQFIAIGATMPPDHVRTWQEFDTLQFEVARSFYRANPAAAKVMLGPALSLDVRIRDLQGLPLIAQRAAEVAATLFEGPQIPDLADRIVEMIVLSDAIWALSIYRYGDITNEMAARATSVRRAYASTFLPSEMAPRKSAPP